MHDERAERLVAGALDARVLTEQVERFLDDHPMQVDEREVEAALHRLEQRLGRTPERRSWWWAVPALAAAASLLWMVSRTAPHSTPAVIEPVQPVAATSQSTIEHLEVEGPFDLAPDQPPEEHIEALVSRGAPDLLFVRSGTLQLEDGHEVHGGQWVVLGDEPVVFDDGQAPPPQVQPLQPRLREVRWEALTDTTRTTLDRLLED